MEIDNIVLLRLQAGSVEDIKDVLTNIIEKNSQRFRFEELNESDRRQKLWSLLFHHLNRPSSAGCHKECLSAIKMLSRDQTDLESMLTNERHVETLLAHAGLAKPQQVQADYTEDAQQKYAIMLEAQKALSNLLYNSHRMQQVCSCNHTMEAAVTRLRLFNEPNLPRDIKMFDIKILFLITALSPDTRPKLKDELHGMLYLVEILDSIMKDASKDDESSTPTLSASDVELCVEVLKVLFNVMLRTASTPQLASDEDDCAQFMKLLLILKAMLLSRTTPEDLLQTLHNHVVNLLTMAPVTCLRELVSVVGENDCDCANGYEFHGKNMEAIVVLINFLDTKLNQLQNSQSSCSSVVAASEAVCPIVSVLIECCKADACVRRYVRAQVLPPLRMRDVTTRPEVGDHLRNKLTRLLTSPHSHLRDLTAELLFVLCKESVARMIKYTGYGNAAGMFADRGLLACRPTSHAHSHTHAHSHANANTNAGFYSSDSEDSETEEYSAYKHQINPILGCYEPPKPDPTNGMTEEQKEYEALRLANMMDRLARDGLIQPCRIGQDGRPEPVEHVLQLQESKNGPIRNEHFTSDDED